MTPICGKASNDNAAIVPPMMMNGRRLPFQNHAWSDREPMMTWPKMPAIGPAAHTSPMSWTSSPNWVVRIQLSAESCTDSASPIAVDGRLSVAKKSLLRSL